MMGFDANDPNLPEELREMLQKLASHAVMSSGLAHDVVADEVMPSDEQRNLGPGDLVGSVMNPAHRIDDEFMVGEILDPKDYAETFPDWEERLYKSYVLCRYSQRGLESEIGWHTRARLVKVTQAQYEEMLGWILNESYRARLLPPRWFIKTYLEAMWGVYEANSELMPVPLKCRDCDSPQVLLRIDMSKIEYYSVGVDKENLGTEAPDQKVLSAFGINGKAVSYEVCFDCGAEYEQPEEQQIYGP